ncbi:MAG: AI-2E family transporter [Methyloprofundus sp.]|nr:AI-2E family transporter [Methyloprofundus sp.]
MKSDASLSQLRDIILILAGMTLLLTWVRGASDIVVPFLLALFISIITVSPVNWLKGKGLSSLLAVGLVIIVVILLLFFIVLMLGSTVEQFNQALPGYQARLNNLNIEIENWLALQGIDIRQTQILKAIDPGALMNFVNKMVIGFGNVLSNAVLIILTVIFMLMEAASFPRKLSMMAGKQGDQALQRIAEMLNSTKRYIAIKAAISLLTGIIIWFLLMLVGLDFAVLWGFLAFVLNFVPTIGSLLAAIPAVLLSLLQLDPVMILAVIAIYITVNAVIGNLIEPTIMGQQVGLSTLSVFLSLVFWGWLFGPVGMLLSVPLTMVVKFMAYNNPQTQWFAILLGPAPEPESDYPGFANN